jgi:hypothetical protein
MSTGYSATVHVRTTKAGGGATVLTESGQAITGSRGAQPTVVT